MKLLAPHEPWSAIGTGDLEEVIERLRLHGGLQGDLSARYSRLRKRMAPVQPGDWLYYAGPSTIRYCPNAARLTGEIVRKLELPCGVLRFEACSGVELLHAGYETIAREIAPRVVEQILSAQACGIICGSPADAWMFAEVYPSWGIDLGLPVVRCSDFLSTLLIEGLLLLEPDETGAAAMYQMPPLTSQNEPLSLAALEAIFPGGVHLRPSRPGMEARVDDEFWESESELFWNELGSDDSVDVDLIITDHPLTYQALQDSSRFTEYRVYDFCQVFADHLVGAAGAEIPAVTL